MSALVKVTITRRHDGLLDVLRERADSGETIRGVRSWEDAFDAVWAHPGVDRSNEAKNQEDVK